MHNVPNRKAPATPAFTWAALATPPVITLSNANGSMAVDSDDMPLRATHPHRWHYCRFQSSKRASHHRHHPSRVIMSWRCMVAPRRHASWPRCPVSHNFSDSKILLFPFPSTKQPPCPCMMHDHQHRPQMGHLDVPHHWTCWVTKRVLHRLVYCAANDTAPGEFQSPLSDPTSTRLTGIWARVFTG